jgi:hypothetical protein
VPDFRAVPLHMATTRSESDFPALSMVNGDPTHVRPSLAHHEAAIHRDRLTGDVACRFTAQEQNGVRNLFRDGLRAAWERTSRGSFSMPLLGRQPPSCRPSVRMRPGHTAFTRMPRVAYSRAALFVKQGRAMRPAAANSDTPHSIIIHTTVMP